MSGARELGALALAGALASLFITSPLGADARVEHGLGAALKKQADAPSAPTLLATLVQTHTEERVLLGDTAPDQPRFDSLLSDRVTGASTPMDPRLLGLLRQLARSHASGDDGRLPPRIELVSGFRSPKLNEMLRKKGHHVATRSQHSLGHAVDFRLIEAGAVRGLDPRQLEAEIRAAGWTGGVGIYRSRDDWFVHADVGPQRRWDGQ